MARVLAATMAVFLAGIFAALPLAPWARAQTAPPQLTARVLINDAPPYRIVTTPPGGTAAPRYSGIYVDVLYALAAEAGLGLDFIEVPYARALRMMEAGEGDVMLGPNRTSQREAYMYFLEPPLPPERKVFLLRPEAAPIQSYEDLRGRSVAVLRGASYFDRFDADVALTKVAVGDYETALRMVAGARVDTVILPEARAIWLLREAAAGYGAEQRMAGLRLAGLRVPGRNSYIALSRRSPLLPQIPKLESALRHLVESGGLDLALQRYQ